LRTADHLAAGKGDEIEPHLLVFKKIFDGGHVGRRVEERGDVVPFCNSDELLVGDAMFFRRVEKRAMTVWGVKAFSMPSAPSTSTMRAPVVVTAWSKR